MCPLLKLSSRQKLTLEQYLIQSHANCGSLEVNTTPCASLHMLKYTDFNAGIGAIQMLGKANFIALIGGGKQPKFPQNKVGHMGILKEATLTIRPGDNLG
jgi:hypothetical protein